ncbi:ABC transporter substrate-binding protein [Alkalihalobacillus alcalophilus ATCC 27647 = CGMCC 1.3604]|uniref:ABC transporter substrate-binding protein n=1 Tax=Alkalihalobacillus alcalophilus ATCC 27647 = CGMCC 1.3604 TaxID=1218173 RepID=A0A094YV51_ALKAL|nr:ABC transporter substrate-binding protein [Alkalihalobacillus alcalophilus]KGA97392.1 ABC transporter substrate-binding protein [Alkalihalobacillus alcalophilus ATCC 27647 = CGMCC 1.3604]MED1561813.1 ABC transporter substrate-binding protein [Alkalihalobacillus alcalophilus]THG90980.1 ABC transporter substrate-binding protein [Alkalihalobacillus alcalophilus ATCC 27647 = CGMCC 1.3604]
MKKMLAFLLVCFLLLSACSSGGADESVEGSTEADEITVWTWDPNFNIKAMEIAKEYYASENPDLTISVIENAQDDIIQKLNTSLSSGTTRGLPNIVLIEDYRAQSFLQAYPDSFHEITGSYNVDDFAPYKIAPTSINDKNYGLPFDTGVAGLYVRTDYLEEAGYTVEDVTNIDWDAFIEIGKDVKEATGKAMLTLDPNDLSQVRMMIQTSGSWYVKEDGVTPDLVDNEALKKAFEVYKAILDADIAKPVSDWSQFLAEFNNGSVASVPTGNWITPSIKAEDSQSGDWAVVPFPTLPGIEGAVNASNLGGSSWYVLDVEGKESAVDFLAKTFGSDVDFYQSLVTEIGAIGTYIPAAEGEAYQAEDEYFGGQTIIADFSSWTEQIPQVNYGLHTYAIDDILVVEMQNYLNGKSIEDVLLDAQKQAEIQVQ